MRSVRAVSTLVLASLLVASLAVPSRAATWVKLQTNDVVIYSDASAKDVVEFAVGYTAFRHAFRELFQPPHPPPPARVLLFRRASEFEKNVPESKREDSHTITYTSTIDGQAFLSLAVDGDRRTALQQVYEFETIWELERAGFFVPIWASQGAGEVLSSLTLVKGGIDVGEEIEGYERTWDDASQVTWQKFFDINTGSEEYAGRNANGEFHAKAWAIMHRVLLADDDGARAFNRIAAELHDKEGLAVMQEFLGAKPDDFDREIRKHLRSGRLRRTLPFDAAALRKQLTTVPAPEAEVHVEIANLLLAAGFRERAEGELARAQGLAPTLPAVKEAGARFAWSNRDTDEGARLYREAIEAGSTNAVAYLRSAQKRMEDVSLNGSVQAGGGGAVAEQAIREIQQALKFNPGSMEAYRLLGRAFFMRNEISNEQIEELKPGITRGPEGEAVRFYRALLYQRLGRTDDYVADLKQIAADRGTSAQLRHDAVQRLTEGELKTAAGQVEALVKEHHYDEARALVKAAQNSDLPGEIARGYDHLGAFIEEAAAAHHVQELYQAKQWQDVVTAGTRFLQDYPESRAARAARRMMDQAKQHLSPATP